MYLAVVQPGQDVPAAPYERAQPLGYEPGVADVACDQGAAAALGVDDGGGVQTVGLVFRTQSDARAAAVALGSPAPVVAEVRAFCLD